jgi:hypothetical protein
VLIGTCSPATIGLPILGLMDPDLSALADVYLRHHLTKRDEDFWAFEEVDRRVRSDLSQAWAVTQAPVEKADTDLALGYVAAGPLEDVVDGYGDAALDLNEAACATNQKLQLALSGIWLEEESPVAIRWRNLMQRYGFLNGSRQPL